MTGTQIPSDVIDPSRVPVIVGVGQVNDRPAEPRLGMDSLDLMEAALRAADEDAGGGWLTDLDSLAVVAQISFRQLGDVSGPLAGRLGATPKVCGQTAIPSGDSPILLLNEAANRIGAGEIGIAAIVGGEALRTAAKRTAGESPPSNAAREASARATPAYRQRYGLVAPVDVYPLYENAGRAAYGQTLVEGQVETGEIWSRFSEVAGRNPMAWLHTPLSPSDIMEPSADNRPIAFPYSKLMVANSAVNQGAGFIVTSLAIARARGVPEDRIVYVGLGAAAHEPDDILARDRYDHSPGMEAVLDQTLELNGLETSDLDVVELYSCFPCVPKMARRILGWPVDRPATVVGGLTFGGGPIGNYMSHAVATMVEGLRETGRYGLLFANGGFATHNHAIVLMRDAPARQLFPRSFDVQPQADAARGPAPAIVEAYVGPGVVESYTVFYDRQGAPRFGVVVGRSPSGERFLGKVSAEDEAGIAALTSGDLEPVGTAGAACAVGEEIHWLATASASTVGAGSPSASTVGAGSPPPASIDRNRS